MRDKYKFQRAKNNMITFIWKVVLAIIVIWVLLYIFEGTAFVEKWKEIMGDIIK